MNDPNSKKILFNKSTLFSLKAELLRKQEEVQEKKQQPQHKIENFKPPVQVKPSEDESSSTKEKKTFKDSLKAIDIEELEACKKAKLALEKKAELYEHLSDGAGTSQLAGRFLVDFNTKKQQEEQTREPSPLPEHDDDDSEWVEFTDCLGRTRKCLKSDLDVYKRKDQELMRIMNINKGEPDCQQDSNKNYESKNDKPPVVQKTNDYIQSLREKWEEKERELLSKDEDIHYQDLLFDEARIHGVGYFSFSTNEKERRKEMDELLKRRQETLQAQKETEALRKQEKDLLTARMAAARARRRAREGLPPEEPQENQKDFTTCLLEFLNKQKDEADNEAKEKEKKMREEKEKERQKLREAFVRQWDLGKEGVDEKIKKFREMTQEEYVEQQRTKRIDEFAPPQVSSKVNSNYTFDYHGRILRPDVADPTPSKTWSEVRPEVKCPSPPIISDVIEPKGLYFSSANKHTSKVNYKNFVTVQEPTPIVCELNNESENKKRKSEEILSESSYANIAPPPTYDYYGPVPKQYKTQKPFDSDIREAYAQGAKSLETKASNRKLPKHYDFTFD